MTLLAQIAQQRTNDVIYTAISLTIEKIATEVARDLLRDPAFRDELRQLARTSVGRAFRDLHKNGTSTKPRARKKRR